MGKNKGKIGYMDASMEDALNEIRGKFSDMGIERLSDRQASKIMVDVFKEIKFDIKRKVKKRKDKFEITLT